MGEKADYDFKLKYKWIKSREEQRRVRKVSVKQRVRHPVF